MAVDLGFGARRTCELAWQTPDTEKQVELTDFGRCVEHVAQFISENQTSALIVEAPLSGLFGCSGNPGGRTRFERTRVDGRTATRYWYVGAGAAVGLGAIFLFSRLSELVVPEPKTVNVIEGFVSFRTQRSDDRTDACALLRGFLEPDSAEIYEVEPSIPEERTVNLLGLAGAVSPAERAPPLLSRL